VPAAFTLATIARAQGFERIGLIDDAVEAFLATEADKKHYLQLASRVARLFKAILPDPLANEMAPLAVLVSYLAAKIRPWDRPAGHLGGDGRCGRTAERLDRHRGLPHRPGQQPRGAGQPVRDRLRGAAGQVRQGPQAHRGREAEAADRGQAGARWWR
jgi:hypothetical protein